MTKRSPGGDQPSLRTGVTSAVIVQGQPLTEGPELHTLQELKPD